jgi:membrane associated rhomboid family serine protease/Zn-finger nucleic acid-binding protein
MSVPGIPPQEQCPRCVLPPLERTEYDGTKVAICPRCAGLWCAPREWDPDKFGAFPAMDPEPAAIAGEEAVVKAALVGVEAANEVTGLEVEKRANLLCPTCRTALNAVKLGEQEPCELDQCSGCGGVWFDKHEWEHLNTLHAWEREQERIAKPTTWGQWCLQFFLGMPSEYNLPPRRFPFVTVGIIALCVLVLVVELIVGEEAWLPFGTAPNKLWQGLGLYTLVTSQFLHAGFLHLVGNMYFLYLLGDNVEDALGHYAFLAFYLACGALADLLHAAIFAAESAPLVGASGAICGVMAAYVLLYPKARLTFMLIFWQFKLSAVWWMTIYVAIQVVAGFITIQKGGLGVGYFAHIGGFVAGLVLILPFRNLIIRRSPWLRVLHTFKDRTTDRPRPARRRQP